MSQKQILKHFELDFTLKFSALFAIEGQMLEKALLGLQQCEVLNQGHPNMGRGELVTGMHENGG